MIYSVCKAILLSVSLFLLLLIFFGFSLFPIFFRRLFLYTTSKKMNEPCKNRAGFVPRFRMENKSHDFL